MAAYTGRGVTLALDDTVVMCFRTLEITHNGESIDATDSCSNGFRELMNESSEESLDISVDGIARTNFLRDMFLGSDSRILEAVTLEWPVTNGGDSGATLVGDFRLSGFSESVSYNELTTFSVTLESTGPWLYTPELTTPEL